MANIVLRWLAIPQRPLWSKVALSLASTGSLLACDDASNDASKQVDAAVALHSDAASGEGDSGSCLYGELLATFEGIVDDARQASCAEDSDCVRIDRLPSCLPTCPAVVAAASEAAFDAALHDEIQARCGELDERDCTGFAVPECAVVTPSCQNSRCQAISAE